MLGRIAIAAMGGCFSQNPDTGAAEATYFPAESAVINYDFSKTIQRPAGTTDFSLGFTQTRFWVKAQILYTSFAAFPLFCALGTQNYVSRANPRTWCFLGAYPSGNGGSIVHNTDEVADILSDVVNPTDVWTSSKEHDSNNSIYTNGVIRNIRTTHAFSDSMTNRTFDFSILGSFVRSSSVRFWGDMMSNHYYDIHWRRQPMISAESQAVAIFDVDGKELVEY